MGRGEYGLSQQRGRALLGAQSTGAFNRLRAIVAQHEDFWGRVAQHSYGHNAQVMKAWLHTAWDPWFMAFDTAVTAGGGVLDDNTATAFAHSLTALRQLAQSSSWLVPVPALQTEARDAVGAEGSLLGHTPGDVENELDQLHTEIMQFGQEVMNWSHQVNSDVMSDPAIAKLYQATKQAFDDVERVPAKGASNNPFLRDPKTQQERIARVAKYHELKTKLDQAILQHHGAPTWDKTTWQPFFDGWLRFHEDKKDVPLQSWPLSGTWDRIQDYRQRFIDTRKNAPFKPTGPDPTSPEGRKDPSFTEGITDLLKIGKYALIGVLAIGGVVALSSVASNLRKGKDPAENYMKLIGTRRQRAPRNSPSERPARAARLRPALRPPAMLQLPAGEVGG